MVFIPELPVVASEADKRTLAGCPTVKLIRPLSPAVITGPVESILTARITLLKSDSTDVLETPLLSVYCGCPSTTV